MKNLKLKEETNIASLSGEGDTYILDYGIKKRGEKGTVLAILHSDEGFKKLRTVVQCGSCTKVATKRLNKVSYEVSISYDMNVVGKINKRASLYVLDEEGVNTIINVLLRGTVKQ